MKTLKRSPFHKFILCVLMLPIFCCLFFTSTKGQSTEELMKKRGYYMSMLDKLLLENEARNEACQKQYDEAISKYSLEELKTQKGKEIMWKLQDIRSDCEQANGESWFAKKQPIEDKIMEFTQKILARNSESRDPDITTLPQTLDLSNNNASPSNRNKKPTKRQCEIIAHYRDKELKDLYYKSLSKYDINQEAKTDFLKMMREVDSEKWKFSKGMGAFYLLDQIGVTTFNLSRNLSELLSSAVPIEGKFLTTANGVIDKWQNQIREGDVESVSNQEVAFNIACKILMNRKTIFGKAATTICMLTNDIKYLTQIQKKTDKTYGELYGLYAKLEYQLSIYEDNMMEEKQTYTGLSDLIQTLDNYLLTHCKN